MSLVSPDPLPSSSETLHGTSLLAVQRIQAVHVRRLLASEATVDGLGFETNRKTILPCLEQTILR